MPSLAIKAGVEQFLTDEYASRHFSGICGYDAGLETGVLESAKTKKRGRSYFPGVAGNFVRGSSQNSRKIFVLLVNMQLLASGKLLSRDDYDHGAEGYYRPFDAMRATRPVVIIDEPHRFSRDQTAFKVIMEEIKPQGILRFGATFPETVSGRGKNRMVVKDYQNLLYDLNACASFNQNLIKGVAKEHLEPASERQGKTRIVSIRRNDSVSVQHMRPEKPAKNYSLRAGDSLGIVSDVFEGITVDAIERSSVTFPNGLEKAQGEEMTEEVYMAQYQEQMLRLALLRHFETEKVNFCERSFRIKTLALFFIDDISSYRAGNDGKKPYLLDAFERLLNECVQSTLDGLDRRETGYRAYLESTLADISACHAGYFSRDKSDTDESVAKEVSDILHGKKRLLSFTNSDGTPNTRRFLFSKWTLKEGWDNPNVFTIAKLRSSGSEISKLQEVGRGWRLPVDENGNRICNEGFWLNYIVDFTEKDFAERLIEQINGEIPQASVIPKEKLDQVAEKLGIEPDDLFFELWREKKYINRDCIANMETRDAFYDEYPDFADGLASGKIKNGNRRKTERVKIRRAKYEETKIMGSHQPAVFPCLRRLSGC